MKKILLFIIALLLPFGVLASTTSYYPLEITNIRPAGTGDPAIPATNRIFRAYPEIEYNVGVAAIGGAYPYRFSLSNAPSGMAINASTGVVTWPKPQSSHNDIVVTVTDSIGNTASATWSITVATDGFIFVDSGYTGLQNGSRTLPFTSIASMLTNIGLGHSEDIVYFYGGDYSAISFPGETGNMDLTGMPRSWVAYPGAGPVSVDMNDLKAKIYDSLYFDSINFTNMTGHGVLASGNDHYHTVRRCVFDGIVNPDNINNNYGFIFWGRGCSGHGALIQDNEFKNYDGCSAIGSMYTMDRALIERNYIHSEASTTQSLWAGAIAAKSTITRLTVRNNKIYRQDGNFILSSGDQNSILFGSTGIEVCFNLFYKTGSSLTFAHVINQRTDYQDFSIYCADHSASTWGVVKDLFYYRNTLVGSSIAFYNADGENPENFGGCNFDIKNNLIIDSGDDRIGYTKHENLYYRDEIVSTSPWLAIENTGNIYLTSSDGVLNINGELEGGYTGLIGAVGWQTVVLSDDPETPTPSGPILRTGSHLLRVGDSVLRVQ